MIWVIEISRNKGDIAILTLKSGREFGKKLYDELLSIKKKEKLDFEKSMPWYKKIIYHTVAKPLMNFMPYDGLEQKIKLIDMNTIDFADKENKVKINETVRGYDVYLVQLTVDKDSKRSEADHVMESLFALNAMRRSVAKGKLNLVMPCLPYSRQDRREGRESCNAKVLANILSIYIDGLITTDLHSSQIAEYYPEKVVSVVPFYASPILIEYVKENYDLKNLMFVSPDAGGLKRAQFFSDRLKTRVAIASKDRSYKEVNKVENIFLLGDVKGKDLVVIDDMIDTAGTIEKVVEELKKHGAREITLMAPHAILSDPATSRLKSLYNKGNGIIKQVICTDTVKHPAEYLEQNKDWLKILSVAPLFAKVIYNINQNLPTSDLYLK